MADDLKELRQQFDGKRFGRLTVCGDVTRAGGRRRISVSCDCGRAKTVRLDHVLNGRTRSCGCLNADLARAPERVARRVRVIHGANRAGRRAPEYTTWDSMIQRCTNPNNTAYRNYGGRGIAVCGEWRQDFRAFLAHVGSRPSRSHSIDRINNDGNYEPGNVRWATLSQQLSNRRPYKKRATEVAS